MNTLLGTEDHRYSLNTLKALHYGATYGGITSRAKLRIQFTGDDFRFYEADVLAVGAAGIFARTDDGHIETPIAPHRILHAEVV